VSIGRRPHLGMRRPTLCRMVPARGALLVLAVSLASGAELRAQVLAATGVRNLSFGDVLPGVPTTVQPTDPVRSGQFDIVGPSGAAIEISFFLPATLDGPGSAKMPVAFGATSAGYAAGGSIGSQAPFDPRVPFRVNLSALGRGSGFIGGALAPSSTQAPGPYRASLNITVALVGL
jgi:hypothetical protein